MQGEELGRRARLLSGRRAAGSARAGDMSGLMKGRGEFYVVGVFLLRKGGIWFSPDEIVDPTSISKQV